MLRTLGVLALASALALAAAPAFGQGMPMGTMKTTNDSTAKDLMAKDSEDLNKALKDAPQQAQALERVTPTYYDTVEDRIMREMTDDGAHDRTDTRR